MSKCLYCNEIFPFDSWLVNHTIKTHGNTALFLIIFLIRDNEDDLNISIPFSNLKELPKNMDNISLIQAKKCKNCGCYYITKEFNDPRIHECKVK